LLVSPYQDHQLIRETGELVGERCGVPFYYHDFRPGYREGARLSKEWGMYRQPYCGCVYSEKERYFRGSRFDPALNVITSKVLHCTQYLTIRYT
jgi:predicted adenine nucleotide alpha hydrolase (AANH) superfamily ATPase